MVWEQQSHTLVMLTNCVESGRVRGAPDPGGGGGGALQAVACDPALDTGPGVDPDPTLGFPARPHPSRLPQPTHWPPMG